jgi:hypothetical protein
MRIGGLLPTAARFPHINNFGLPASLSKTRVFERAPRNGKGRSKSGLNLSQNAFLVSASQKARVRLSFERDHDDQTDKDRSHNHSDEAATSTGRVEGRASSIIGCRRDHVEADADRLCPRFDAAEADAPHTQVFDGFDQLFHRSHRQYHCKKTSS